MVLIWMIQKESKGAKKFFFVTAIGVIYTCMIYYMWLINKCHSYKNWLTFIYFKINLKKKQSGWYWWNLKNKKKTCVETTRGV